MRPPAADGSPTTRLRCGGRSLQASAPLGFRLNPGAGHKCDQQLCRVRSQTTPVFLPTPACRAVLHAAMGSDRQSQPQHPAPQLQAKAVLHAAMGSGWQSEPQHPAPKLQAKAVLHAGMGSDWYGTIVEVRSPRDSMWEALRVRWEGVDSDEEADCVNLWEVQPDDRRWAAVPALTPTMHRVDCKRS